jgi:hypothetical protein
MQTQAPSIFSLRIMDKRQGARTTDRSGSISGSNQSISNGVSPLKRQSSLPLKLSSPTAAPKELAIRKLLTQLDDYRESLADPGATSSDKGSATSPRDSDGNRLSIVRICIELRKNIDQPGASSIQNCVMRRNITSRSVCQAAAKHLKLIFYSKSEREEFKCED